MPAILKIDRRRKLVSSTFYGQISGEDLLRHRTAIASDPDFDSNFSEIVAFSGVTLADVSESTLTAMAHTKSLFSESVMHVVVAPADFPFDMATKYQALVRATRPNLHVVRSLQEAYALLGLETEISATTRQDEHAR
jgi:hypothetical protein